MDKNRLIHKRRAREYYTPVPRRRRRACFVIVLAVLGMIFGFCAVRLVRYAADYTASRRTSQEIRALYYSGGEPTAEIATQTDLSPAPTHTPVPTATPEPLITLDPSTLPSPSLKTILPAVPYPYNPHVVMNSRFVKLWEQNRDIVGWLNVATLLDEPVVQRDNEYYLRRDYKGYHNINGSLFLDEDITLRTRPYTLIIYGHNMKTGAMFGSLREYEKPAFYRSNPIITFDSIYEEGRYVIFSVTTMSLKSYDYDYLNLAKLSSSTATWRQEVIDDLIGFSMYSNVIDVTADDQVLLLVTCVDDNADRRVIAARRIREDESEAELIAKFRRSWPQ